MHLAPSGGVGKALFSGGTRGLSGWDPLPQPSGISVLPFCRCLGQGSQPACGSHPRSTAPRPGWHGPPRHARPGPHSQSWSQRKRHHRGWEIEWGSSRAGAPPPHPNLCLPLLRSLQMNQIPVGGRPASGLQDPPQLYPPASQAQSPLPPGTQQVLEAWGGGGRAGLGDTHSCLGLAREFSEPQFTPRQHEDNIPHVRVMESFIQSLKTAVRGRDRITSWGCSPDILLNSVS